MFCKRVDNHKEITRYTPGICCTMVEDVLDQHVYPRIVQARYLRPGDTVRTFDGAWSTATVVRNGGDVELFRPYVHFDEHSRTPTTIIPYVGFETYSISPNNHVVLLERR